MPSVADSQGHELSLRKLCKFFCVIVRVLQILLPARRLMTQLAADCALLEELRVMDYSLLLGIHSRSSGWTSSPHATDRVCVSVSSLPQPQGSRL